MILKIMMSEFRFVVAPKTYIPPIFGQVVQPAACLVAKVDAGLQHSFIVFQLPTFLLRDRCFGPPGRCVSQIRSRTEHHSGELLFGARTRMPAPCRP